jgi:hypothetical protein
MQEITDWLTNFGLPEYCNFKNIAFKEGSVLVPAA